MQWKVCTEEETRSWLSFCGQNTSKL